MRRVLRWVFGSSDEHAFRRQMRFVPLVLILAPWARWIGVGDVPELSLWIECYAVALVALLLLNHRRRGDPGEHRVRIVEHRPPPGEDWRPFKTAECCCGWVVDDRSDAVTDFMARKHSPTGPPATVSRQG